MLLQLPCSITSQIQELERSKILTGSTKYQVVDDISVIMVCILTFYSLIRTTKLSRPEDGQFWLVRGIYNDPFFRIGRNKMYLSCRLDARSLFSPRMIN